MNNESPADNKNYEEHNSYDLDDLSYQNSAIKQDNKHMNNN